MARYMGFRASVLWRADAHLMHPGAGGDDAATVATQLAAAKLVDRPHLEEQLWPTVEALERVVQVERMRPHRRLV